MLRQGRTEAGSVVCSATTEQGRLPGDTGLVGSLSQKGLRAALLCLPNSPAALAETPMHTRPISLHPQVCAAATTKVNTVQQGNYSDAAVSLL